MTNIAIIIGSTRPGRKADAVARWVHDLAATRADAHVQIIDLADHQLPHLDEPVPPALGQYRHAHTRAWAETIAAFDGYVFITPEYNHSTSGVLKNAIDYLSAEWANKAAGFVSYGGDGGVRAVEHLRLMMGELQVADVRAQVSLSLATDFENMTEFRPAEHRQSALTAMLDQLVAWTQALEPLRAA